ADEVIGTFGDPEDAPDGAQLVPHQLLHRVRHVLAPAGVEVGVDARVVQPIPGAALLFVERGAHTPVHEVGILGQQLLVGRILLGQHGNLLVGLTILRQDLVVGVRGADHAILQPEGEHDLGGVLVHRDRPLWRVLIGGAHATVVDGEWKSFRGTRCALGSTPTGAGAAA